MKINPSTSSGLGNTFKLIIAIGVSLGAGVIGSFFTTPAVQSDWYAGLVKPALNPPAWVFGPVWTTLFALMGIAVFLVYIKDEKTVLSEVEGRLLKRKKRVALTLFGIQLVLNTLWSIIFFGLHSPGSALIEIVFLWLAILATIIVFAKISKPAAWLLAPYILWVSFAGYLNFSIWQLNPSTGSGQVACTQEAKLCPDGSYVGRAGPKCEFTACPIKNADAPWKTYTDNKLGISFRYPENPVAKYMEATDWPPQIQVLNEPFTCTKAGSETARAGQTLKRMVDDRTYCVTKVTEGAAGSIYTQYAYAFPKDNKTVIFTFSIRYAQCSNYGEPEKTECENLRTSFDLDSVIDRIAKTVILTDSGQTQTGIIKGLVLLGPICPVERMPPNPTCADKPYKTTVQIIKTGSPKSSPYAAAESNNEGQYEITLPVGEYSLQPIGGSPLPRCETKDVVVEPEKSKEINISCDTGIR